MPKYPDKKARKDDSFMRHEGGSLASSYSYKPSSRTNQRLCWNGAFQMRISLVQPSTMICSLISWAIARSPIAYAQCTRAKHTSHAAAGVQTGAPGICSREYFKTQFGQPLPARKCPVCAPKSIARIWQFSPI